ncbi:MAG: hypothetical protein DMG85_09810, partial [Acidobacteria bacterium]
DQQYRETDGVGQQRRQAGQEEPAEGEARCDVPIGAAADVLEDAVHLLCAMTHADGKHEEWDQHGVRIQGIAQQRQQTELPQHAGKRGQHHQQRAAHVAVVHIHHGRRDEQRDDEEAEHLA